MCGETGNLPPRCGTTNPIATQRYLKANLGRDRENLPEPFTAAVGWSPYSLDGHVMLCKHWSTVLRLGRASG